MTLSTTDTKIQLTGDGVTTVFTFDFAIQQASDMTVYVNNVAIVAGYTVQINDNFVGGTVTITPAPANLAPVLLVRMVDLTQETVIPTESDIPELALEDAYDHAIMAIQQLDEKLTRTLTLPITAAPGTDLDLPTPEPDMFLRWNDAGTALENVSVSSASEGVLGPSVSTTHSLALWNVGDGSLLKDGPALGTAGQVLTSLGAAADPSFQNFDIKAQTLNGYRLSALATDPNPQNDVLGATSVFWLPSTHDIVGAYDGISLWTPKIPGALSLAIPANQFFRQYHVYFDPAGNAGAGALFFDAWDSAGQVSFPISNLTIATPCVVTVTAHTFVVGDIVGVRQGTGTGTAFTDANKGLDGGIFYVSATAANTITLEGSSTTGNTFTAAGNSAVYRIPPTAVTGQTKVNGRAQKTGDLTKSWLGTFRTNGAGTLDDSMSARRLSNAVNQKKVGIGSEDVTASYAANTSATFYMRTNGNRLGISRIELVLATQQWIEINLTDGIFGGNFISIAGFSVDRNVAATLANMKTNLQAYAGIEASVVSGSAIECTDTINLLPGTHFIQHNQYGNSGGIYTGRNDAAAAGSGAIAGMSGYIDR